MDTLLHKFGGKIKGVIEGFDRIVFKGILKPLCYAGGMQLLLNKKGVLNKSYKDWVQASSTAIVKDAEDYSVSQCGIGVQYLPTYSIRKETLAHEQQTKLGIESGLVGSWSCVESCRTFKAVYDKAAGFPQIKADNSRCKHIYFYYDHKDYGFMSVRLQTWAPYEIQIAMNGRQWLKRSLDKAGVGYALDGNKFFAIEDYGIANALLDSQLGTRWIETLSSFVPTVFPSKAGMLGDGIDYTWTLWQNEWAKDYIFHDPQVLSYHMGHLLRHAFLTGTSERVLRYMGHPVQANGQPHWSASPELSTRVNYFYDGARIRHWVDRNSLKFYNEHNVLRFEFTMNDPTKFKIRREVEGSGSGEKKFLPMRKGIADIAVRAKISSSRINSLTEQVATLNESMSVGELVSNVANPILSNGKRYRGLDVAGKDLPLLQAVSDPKYFVDAITNRHLQKTLIGSSWANRLVGRKLASRISRHLRLLREHGIIRKLPDQNKYALTAKGRSLTTALNGFLGASVNDLSKLTA